MLFAASQRHSCLSIHLFAILFALTSPALAQQPTQTYCSTQNTGSDNQPMFWHFMSLGYCHDACVEEYAFAVVNYETCWCSNYVPYDQGQLSQCTAQCPGYPQEECGGGDGSDYFGYVALNKAPSGTIGAPSNPPDTTTKTITSTPTPTTVFLTSVNTIVSTELMTETPTQGSSSSPLSNPTPLGTSVSELVITHVVTSIFDAPTTSPAANQTPGVVRQNGLSGGAIAGIVIGVLAAVALLSLLFFFLCWRPRRDDDGSERGLGRNASVLSRVGLLRNQNHHSKNSSSMAASAAGASAAMASGRTRNLSEHGIVSDQPPQLNTHVPHVFSSGEPSSAATGGTMESRRGSKPLFVDQRLNPYALTMQPNASRTSIGTLEDNQDYSRPLEIKNPDPT